MKQSQAAIKRVSAVEASHLLRIGYVVLDVRTEAEFQQGHCPGAVNVPYRFFKGMNVEKNERFIQVVRSVLAADAKVVVVGKIGKRSLAAATELQEAGYRCVVELRPGFLGVVDGNGRYVENGWRGLGLPIETGSEGTAYSEVLARLAA